MLKVIQSSSRGNSYAITCRNETLLLEAGITIDRLRKEVDMSKVVGCLVSHRHADHAAYIKNFSKRMRVGTCSDCAVFFDLPDECTLHHGETYRFGAFHVSPFEVPHVNADGSPCPAFGYLIRHADIGSILFVTDAYVLPFRFDNIKYFIIEANYDDDIISESLRVGDITKSQYDRIILSHMSLTSAIESIRQCGTDDAASVILIHLSARHSDERRFVARVQAGTGLPCYIAKPGATFQLTPF